MINKLKIVFAGTPEIAKKVLESLLINQFQVNLVLTQPDRPAGRGMKLTSSPVKNLALEHGIEVSQPISFKKNPEVIQQLELLQPDIMIVVAYGLILPKEVLHIPKFGCINIHVSLLPRWRGAAPIQRAILAGDKTTGVTIMRMDEGLDTGDILLTEEVVIDANETSLSLHDKLANIGAVKVIEYLNNYQNIQPIKQNITGVTYANKIDKIEALINWNEDAITLERKIRGYNPFPGMYSYLDGKLYKIWLAEVALCKVKPNVCCGEIIATDVNYLTIACGNATALNIIEIQESGSKRKPIALFMQNKHNLLGKIFLAE